MATATGTNVKFVKVKTKQQYTDYTEKDGALIFVENERKIYVDGIAYGFSDSDVANKFVKLTGDTMTGDLTITNAASNDSITISDDKVDFIHSDGVRRDIRPVGGVGSLAIFVGDTGYYFYESGLQISHGQGDDPVRISGVADPNHTYDAVNKGYLETNVINKIGVAEGIASLDESGKVPSTQLPSYVDDVEEYSNKASFPATGESGKLYVDIETNKLWRWSGSTYVNVSDGNANLVLGETESTAYRGDRGKTAYDHTFKKNNPHGITKDQILLGLVENNPMATLVEAESGTLQTRYMSPFHTKVAIEKFAPKLSWEVVE